MSVLPVPSPFVDRAVPVRQADILCILLNGALEESLASLARAHAVVLAGGVVAADGAQQAFGIGHQGAGRRAGAALAAAGSTRRGLARPLGLPGLGTGGRAPADGRLGIAWRSVVVY